MQIPHFEHPSTVLKRYQLRSKKSWGQNFLASPKAIGDIVRTCTVPPPGCVLEIGGGLGTLTSALLLTDIPVFTIERDPDMCAVLTREFGAAPHFHLIEHDAKTIDYRDFFTEHPGVVVGNLPYQITGEIIKGVLDACPLFSRGVLMVQREVGDRICAPEGTPERGALSVIIDARCKVRRVLNLKPTAFFPPPKVRSTVICITPRKMPQFGDIPPNWFDTVVKSAFCTRRKTLKNALRTSGNFTTDILHNALTLTNIDPERRAETLSTKEFCSLAEATIAVPHLVGT